MAGRSTGCFYGMGAFQVNKIAERYPPRNPPRRPGIRARDIIIVISLWRFYITHAAILGKRVVFLILY